MNGRSLHQSRSDRFVYRSVMNLVCVIITAPLLEVRRTLATRVLLLLLLLLLRYPMLFDLSLVCYGSRGL